MSDKNSIPFVISEESFYCKRKKLLWIWNAKCASTSIKWWLFSLELPLKHLMQHKNSAESDPDLIVHDSFVQHLPNGYGPCADFSSMFFDESYFIFTVTRNPFTRIFSGWQSKILLGESLQSKQYYDEDFFNIKIDSKSDIKMAFELFLSYIYKNEFPNIKDPHWSGHRFTPYVHEYPFVRIYKIEEKDFLIEDLKKHLGSFQNNNPFRFEKNTSIIPYSSDFFSEKSIEIIHKMYDDDFNIFGYGKEVPPGNSVSDDYIKASIHAIKLIQGRNFRIGQIRDLLHEERNNTRDMSKTIYELNQSIQQHTSTISEMESLNKQTTEEFKNIHNKLEKANTNLNENKKENAHLKNQLELSQARISELETESIFLTENIKENTLLKNHINQIQKRICELETENTRLNEVTNENELLKKQIEQGHVRIRELETKNILLDDTTKENIYLKNAIEQNIDKLSEMKTNNIMQEQESNSIISNLKEKIQDATIENSKLQEKIVIATSNANELQAELDIFYSSLTHKTLLILRKIFG